MESESVKSYKVALGAVLAILVVVGLYFINRYWIAPATQNQPERSQRAENRSGQPEGQSRAAGFLGDMVRPLPD
jgi:cytochrome c-type biogenesis protein CcmH/NrfG